MKYRNYQLSERQREIMHGALIYADTFLDDMDSLKGIPAITQEEINSMLACFSLPITDEDPGDPLWKKEPFTELDRANMMDMMQDEIRDCVKEIAEERLDSTDDPVELVSYADEDPQKTAEFLQAVQDGPERVDFEDTPQSIQQFAYRMDLVTTVPTRACGDDFAYALTELGRRYLTDYQ
jgi:hypothetical protein